MVYNLALNHSLRTLLGICARKQLDYAQHQSVAAALVSLLRQFIIRTLVHNVLG